MVACQKFICLYIYIYIYIYIRPYAKKSVAIHWGGYVVLRRLCRTEVVMSYWGGYVALRRLCHTEAVMSYWGGYVVLRRLCRTVWWLFKVRLLIMNLGTELLRNEKKYVRILRQLINEAKLSRGNTQELISACIFIILKYDLILMQVTIY